MSDQTAAGPRFPERIEIRATANLRQLLDQAAEQELTTPSAYARRAILNQLRADGIDPANLEPVAG